MALIDTPQLKGDNVADNIAKEDLYLKDELGITRFVAAGDRIPPNLKAPESKAKSGTTESKKRTPAENKSK